jgi:hypothetical protein
MPKLSDQQRSTIKLILRSPDRGEGWRSVSSVLWPMIREGLPADLAELRPEGDAGFIRLTARGQAVADYL